MKKIAVINQKGGVGKSMVAVNVAYELAALNKKTLLVDLDPQNHSGAIFEPNKHVQYTIKDLFFDQKLDVTKALVSGFVRSDEVINLDVVHSSISFAKVAEQVSSRIHREKILHNHLRKISSAYEYSIIDCPPNLGVITVNAIYTSDIILIPVSYDKGALDGMADLFETIKEVKEANELPYLIVRNLYDIRNKQTNAYIDAELEPFKNRILATRIRRNESLNQSRIAGEPIQVYDPQSKGAADYKDLTLELVQYVEAIR